MLIRPCTRRVIGIAMLIVIAAVSAAFVGTGVGITKIPVNRPGSSSGGSCSGTINLSTGCTQPMLGGL